MKKSIGSYLHILSRNELSDGTQILHVNEFSSPSSSSPPPYTEQAHDSDWKHEIIEIKPLNDQLNKYGFVISGGIDTANGLSIVITHIDSCSNICLDNGRTKLRLFDCILSVNDINLKHVTHDEAVQAFSLFQGQSIKLHIYRLNPLDIDHIDLILPSDFLEQPLGIRVNGGIDNINNDSDDPGLFITYIDPHGLLASLTRQNQLRVGDRLLEIKSNYTSANLQWITLSTGTELIRRICQDHRRVTLIVSHRT